MAETKQSRNSNKRGSTLLTVVTVSSFAAILIAAVLGFVSRAHKNAYDNHNSEQAYYIATSALDSIHDYLEKDGSDYTTLLSMAGANGGAGSNGTVKLGDLNMEDVIPGSECTVNVSYMGTAYIKVAVTGTCNGQSKTINAYYSVVTNSVPAQIDNAIYAEGDITFSLSAESAGAVTSQGNYKTSNNSKASGSIVTDGDFIVDTSYTWTDDPDGCGSFIVAGGNFYNNNSGTTFYPSFTKNEFQNTSEFIAIKGGFVPMQSMSIGTAAKVMDLYANSVYLGGAKSGDTFYKSGIGGVNSMSLVMFGNMYCYKIENSADPNFGHTDDGDFIVNNDATSLKLKGDMFVEGDIRAMTNHEVRITGTLYISDTTTITTMNNRGVICDSISYSTNTAAKVLDMIKNNKIRIPKYKDNASCNEFYTAAEFETLMNSTLDADKARIAEIVKTDAIVHTVSNNRNYMPSTDYNDYKRDYQSTKEFVENTATIKNLYNSALSTTTNKLNNFKLSSEMNDSELGLNFKYVINDNYCLVDNADLSQSQNSNILVDMTQFTGDCVIVVNTENGTNGFSNVNLIVKNEVRNDDGSVAQAGEGFCYIILAYDNDDSTSSELTMNKVNIYDYYTYKNVIKGGKAINLTTYIGANDEVINSITTDKVWTPSLGRTYLMANVGDSVNFNQNTSNNLCEAILYAPGVTIYDAGCGNSNLQYLFDATKPDEVKKFTSDKRVSFLGAMVCANYVGSSNTFAVAFSAPAPGSGVGASGSANKTLVTFSHYESR